MKGNRAHIPITKLTIENLILNSDCLLLIKDNIAKVIQNINAANDDPAKNTHILFTFCSRFSYSFNCHIINNFTKASKIS